MRIFVSTPVHGWDISCAYWGTMRAIEDECRRREWSLYQTPRFGISDLIKARNVDVHKMLKTDADVLLTFDSDQGMDIPTFLGLVESPHYLTAAPVRKKLDRLSLDQQWNFVCEPDCEPVVEGQYMRVAIVGSGAMAIKREILLDMCYQYRVFMVEGEPVPELYARDFTNNDVLFPEQLSEDFSFCMRARNVGHCAWLYVPGKVTHLGMKRFEGSLHV